MSNSSLNFIMRLYRDGPLNGKYQSIKTLSGGSLMPSAVCSSSWLGLLYLLSASSRLLKVPQRSTSGNISQMNRPFDPDRKGCGKDHPDHPYIYFASPHPEVRYRSHAGLMDDCMCEPVSSPSRHNTVLQAQLNSKIMQQGKPSDKLLASAGDLRFAACSPRTVHANLTCTSRCRSFRGQ